MIPAASAVHAPAVSAPIDCPESWSAKVEVAAVWVACVDGEVPISAIPIKWTIEIAGCAICAILPIEKNIA